MNIKNKTLRERVQVTLTPYWLKRIYEYAELHHEGQASVAARELIKLGFASLEPKAEIPNEEK